MKTHIKSKDFTLAPNCHCSLTAAKMSTKVYATPVVRLFLVDIKHIAIHDVR